MLKFEVGEAHLQASSLSGHQFPSFSEFYMQKSSAILLAKKNFVTYET